MFNLILKNLAARKMRLVITGFAVLLGVAFMAGTLVFTDTIGARSTACSPMPTTAPTPTSVVSWRSTTRSLGEQRPRVDTELIDRINALDGVRIAEGYSEAYAQIVDKHGEAMGNPDMGAPVVGGQWVTDDELNPFELETGRPPTRPTTRS